MFDAPFVAEEEQLLFGNIGIEAKVRCHRFGFVMNTGGIGLHQVKHDCVACEGLIQKFGTCEYMHQANPSRCTCKFTAPRIRENVQSVLQTESTDRARLRYWMKWLRNQEWLKEDVAQDGTSSSQDRRQSTLDEL